MGILHKPLQGSHPYKPIPSIIEYQKGVLNIAQITPVLIVIQMTRKKRHVDLVGVWFFFATFPPNLAKLSIFLFSWPLKFGMHSICTLDPFQRFATIGSHDVILRYCMLQQWFGGWAKKERLPVTSRILIFLVRDPHKPSFATATGWGVDASFFLVNKIRRHFWWPFK